MTDCQCGQIVNRSSRNIGNNSTHCMQVESAAGRTARCALHDGMLGVACVSPSCVRACNVRRPFLEVAPSPSQSVTAGERRRQWIITTNRRRALHATRHHSSQRDVTVTSPRRLHPSLPRSLARCSGGISVVLGWKWKGAAVERLYITMSDVYGN